MIHEDNNFSGQQPAAQPGDVFTGCNISQSEPHTQICADVPGLRFVGCNLVNCDLPEGAVAVDCNRTQARFTRTTRIVMSDGIECEIETVSAEVVP